MSFGAARLSLDSKMGKDEVEEKGDSSEHHSTASIDDSDNYIPCEGNFSQLDLYLFNGALSSVADFMPAGGKLIVTDHAELVVAVATGNKDRPLALFSPLCSRHILRRNARTASGRIVLRRHSCPAENSASEINQTFVDETNCSGEGGGGSGGNESISATRRLLLNTKSDKELYSEIPDIMTTDFEADIIQSPKSHQAAWGSTDSSTITSRPPLPPLTQAPSISRVEYLSVVNRSTSSSDGHVHVGVSDDHAKEKEKEKEKAYQQQQQLQQRIPRRQHDTNILEIGANPIIAQARRLAVDPDQGNSNNNMDDDVRERDVRRDNNNNRNDGVVRSNMNMDIDNDSSSMEQGNSCNQCYLMWMKLKPQRDAVTRRLRSEIATCTIISGTSAAEESSLRVVSNSMRRTFSSNSQIYDEVPNSPILMKPQRPATATAAPSQVTATATTAFPRTSMITSIGRSISKLESSIENSIGSVVSRVGGHVNGTTSNHSYSSSYSSSNNVSNSPAGMRKVKVMSRIDEHSQRCSEGGIMTGRGGAAAIAATVVTVPSFSTPAENGGTGFAATGAEEEEHDSLLGRRQNSAAATRSRS